MQDNETAAGPHSSDAAGQGDPLGNHSEIGRKLKEYYEDLVSDAVPDRFADLLSRLERAESAQKEEG